MRTFLLVACALAVLTSVIAWSSASRSDVVPLVLAADHARATPSQRDAESAQDIPRDLEEALAATEPDAKSCRSFRAGHCADPRPNDHDADGYGPAFDCDEHNFHVRPFAPEISCNGVDEDCDGTDECSPDDDGDGFRADVDCDDDDAQLFPRAREIPCNGLDEDCSGADLCDRDGDGLSPPADCDDHAREVHRLARDLICDGIDQDCSGADCCEEDADGDGASCASDCDDHDAHVHPGRVIEPWERAGCMRRDLDCDGKIDGTNCL